MPTADFIVGIGRCNEPISLLIESLTAIGQSSARPRRVIIIDNGEIPLGPLQTIYSYELSIVRPERNLGCAGAWNLIHKLAAPYPTVVMNTDLMVAPSTFASMLSSSSPVVCAYGFGCFSIDAKVRREIGEFDEEFWPVYWEDTDYRRRLQLAGIVIEEWPVTAVATVAPGRTRAASGIVHGHHEPDSYQGWTGERLAEFQCQLEANRQRYIAKWGGGHTEETFTTPWNSAH